MDQQTTLIDWHSRIWRAHFAHNVAASDLERRHRGFGVCTIVLSTVAGTTVFATLEASPNVYLKILVGLLSIAAAVLASLQTFLRYADLAEKHKIVAVQYGELRTELEQLLACPSTGAPLGEVMELLRVRWKALNQEAPIISQRVWDRVNGRIDARKVATSERRPTGSPYPDHGLYEMGAAARIVDQQPSHPAQPA
jgi:hypothetical protein